MSHKRPPKTEGLTWLEHSLNAFNGSGYRDDTSPEMFMDSYIDYKHWKKRTEAAQLAITYYHAVLPLAKHLIEQSDGASTSPNLKNWTKWQKFKELRNTTLL